MKTPPMALALAEAGRAHAHWLCNQNQTHATALLGAVGGSEDRAAQAMQALGAGRLGALMDADRGQALLHTLSVPDRMATLNDPQTSPADRALAMSALRAAAKGYAPQPQAAGTVTAKVGQPERFPPQINALGTPRPGAIETFTVQKEVLYKALGGTADRAIIRHVYEPWERYVAQPTAAKAMDMYARFLSTPVGQYFEEQRVKGASVVNSVIGDGTPIGTALAVFDRAVVKNERLWDGVDKAGAIGRKAAAGAAATTLAIIANGYRTGTLQTGTFNTNGALTPEQLQMVKGVNLPRNMNVRYFTVPTTIPVTVKGHTYNVKAAATIVVGDGSNVLLLPALGPGKPGAQPWFGPVQDGGLSRNEKQLVAASSSVAAAHWNVLGFNIGTTNMNVSGRADLQAGRGLFNIFAAQLKREAPPPGQPRATLQTILIGDLLSTFHSATFNVGPLAVVVDRYRDPQNERITLPRGAKTVTLGGDAHSSSVQPAFPLTGSGTWDPNAGDIGLLKAMFGAPPSANPEKP
jgi:hypothetical protein